MSTKLFFLVFSYLIFTLLFVGCEKKSSLYFCEDYVDGKEIGVSKRFTPGYLTVMVDLRPENKKVGAEEVELILTQIKDENGTEIAEKEIDRIPFTVKADWDYFYFQNKERLGFKLPGTYRVTLADKNGNKIASGEIEVVKK
ncbi:MAG: DUF2914 domain-containing protein [Ignavibacteria bacterium]|nr:DUF2914 domain-containing protein [Ignavibacteria bacterium]